MRAAEKGDTKRVNTLLDSGADPNNFNGYVAPLHMAALLAHPETVKALLDGKANVNGADNRGVTPLHMAVSCREAANPQDRFKTVELLIERGANVNALHSWGDGGSALLTAIGEGCGADIIALLIENGADVNHSGTYFAWGNPWTPESDRRGRDVLSPLQLAEKNDQQDIVKLLKSAQTGCWKPNSKIAAEDAAFEKALEQARKGSVPAELPEEAVKYSVQANYAVNQKRFTDAADRYAEALQVSPWWAEGRFNRALVLEKCECYGEAIREMKRYLQLSPNAPDARKAQDKIYEWESVKK